MLTTLDTQPQEWMNGNAEQFHTVAACQFQNLQHIEHWINKLIPRNQNNQFVKWSGGRNSKKYRDIFMDNCLKHSNEIDFKTNCVSTKEHTMSWLSQVFYMQNTDLFSQQKDHKNRNNLVMKITDDSTIKMPVLRAGYLISYMHIIRYLEELEGLEGKVISDNFCGDGKGIEEDKAFSVRFLNYLLKSNHSKIQISLPINNRMEQCDRISDFFCGWVNSIRSQNATEFQISNLKKLESHSNNFIDNVFFECDANFSDQNGVDISEAIKTLIETGPLISDTPY